MYFTKHIHRFLFVSLILVSLFGLYESVFAQFITGDTSDLIGQQLGAAGALDPSGETIPPDPRLVAAYVVRVFLSFLGTILFILTVMSGYWYFTARGNDEKVTKAKDTMRQAIMGMAIILLAYAITSYIIVSLSTTLKQGNQEGPGDEYRFGDLWNPNSWF